MQSKISIFSQIFVLVVLILQVYSASASVVASDASSIQRRQAPQEASPQENRGQGDEKLTPEEEEAVKVFDVIIQMAGLLENVTSLGTKTPEIVDGANKATALIPELSTLGAKLLEKVPNNDEKLNTAVTNAIQAGDKMTQSLKAISENAGDANLIKSHYDSLEETFKAMLFATDEITTAAVPRLAQQKNEEANAPKDDQNSGKQLSQEGNAAPAASQDPSAAAAADAAAIASGGAPAN